MSAPASAAIQDFYPEDFAHCFGCGRLNEHGHRLKSRWDGEEIVAYFRPEPFHMSVPGFVYGGLLASLLDCHGMATAAAAVERREGREIGDGPAPRFVTAMLKVDYLRPTPLGPELEIRGSTLEVGARKVSMQARVMVRGEVTARAEIVAVAMPESMGRRG